MQPALWVFGACYVPAFLQARGWHVPRAAANADTRAAPCIPVKTVLGGPESQYHHYQTSTSNPFRASLFGHHRRPSTTLFSLLVQLLLAFPPFYCLSSAARLTPALNPNHHRAFPPSSFIPPPPLRPASPYRSLASRRNHSLPDGALQCASDKPFPRNTRCAVLGRSLSSACDDGSRRCLFA